MSKNRFDVGRIDGPMVNDKGYLKAEAFATRTGVFTYMLSDGTFRRELRHPEDVFSKESMDSLSEVVITNNHPPEPLNSMNTRKYACGFTGKDVRKKDLFIQVDTTITDHSTIVDVIENGKHELSCGYTCDIENVSGEYEGNRYDAIQRNIKYNHLSVVDKGRAGPEVKLKMDHADDFAVMKEDASDGGQKKYSKSGNNHVCFETSNLEKEFLMAKMTIDSVEYEVSESVAQVVQAKLNEATSLKKDLDDAKKAEDNLKGRVDALESELKSRNDKIAELEAKDMSDVEIMKRADEISKVVGFAKKIVGKDFKADGMSLAEIKRAVVSKIKPDVNIEEKSDGYVDGAFDALSENHEDSDVKNMNDELANVSTATKRIDANEARIRSMQQDIKNFQEYKGA